MWGFKVRGNSDYCPSIILLENIVCCYYLYACMATQVKVKLKGMSDAGIHCSPCRNIPALPNLLKKTQDNN